MVMVNTTISEMGSILKKKLHRKDYDDLCLRYGIDLSGDGEYLNFEMSSDRIELVSKHAVAFLIGQLAGVGVHRSDAVASRRADISIDRTERRFVNVLHVKLFSKAGDSIDELMTIQDKFSKTVGRDRKLAAIGMFDYSKIRFPVTYSESGADKVEFTPLGSSGPKSYKQVMEDTDKGREYGHLLGKKPIVWRQKDGKIFALPPVINAEFASISKDTRELFIDITGTSRDAVNSVTKALVFNMQFFGDVTLLNPVYKDKSTATEISFKTETFFLGGGTISKLLGADINIGEAGRILSKLGYTVSHTAGGIKVTPPFYRDDVIHQVDIIDDIMRVYGVQKITPDERRTYTAGKTLPNTQTIDIIRDTLVGLGYQELDLNVLTNESYQFNKTGIEAADYAAFLGTKSAETTMARKNIMPEGLRFVSNNLHKRFPQKLFDIGFVVSKGDSDVGFSNRLRLCIMSCGADSNMSEMVIALDKLVKGAVGDAKITLSGAGNLGGFLKTVIEGRAGTVSYGGKKIGVLGEVHPRVLNEFGIELPVSFAEIDLDTI